MKRFAVVIALCLVSLPSFAADKIPVSMVVVCADKGVGDKFTRAMTSQFKTHADYELTDKLPKATLFVYVNQDVEDRKNPNGWSIAIAHVNNQTIQAVAGQTDQRHGRHCHTRSFCKTREQRPTLNAGE